jgi:protoporphyrinogen oxidase
MNVAILGGGPAGLVAGKVLTDHDVGCTLFEQAQVPGGMAKTMLAGEFRFDLGGHRFYTKYPEIEQLLQSLLPDELVRVRRRSKILLRHRYFEYPLQPFDAFWNLGLRETLRILVTYSWEKIFAHSPRPQNFEDWTIGEFGSRLYHLFFKEYTEKVWGINCHELDLDWAHQRIGGLSLKTALLNALRLGGAESLPTLLEHFWYPARGIGRIGEVLAQAIARRGTLQTGASVTRVCHDGRRLSGITWRDGSGAEHEAEFSHFLASIPLTDLVTRLAPACPPEILAASSQLRFRDLIVVALMFPVERITDQCWIYIPDEHIPFGRIHEPKNWSLEMAPKDSTCLVFEYFCNRGDPLWQTPDESILANTFAVFQKLGLAQNIPDYLPISQVIRVRHAYPIYVRGFKEHLAQIQNYLGRFDNLDCIGRCGTFTYNNMDHSMLAGLKAATKLLSPDSPLNKLTFATGYLEDSRPVGQPDPA